MPVRSAVSPPAGTECPSCLDLSPCLQNNLFLKPLAKLRVCAVIYEFDRK